MKLFTFLFFALFITTSVIAQDTIPNPGFENWDNEGTYYDPSGWNVLNDFVASLHTSATKDSVIVHSGHYSIKLTSLQAIVGQNAPGLVTTGNINPNNEAITGGVPVSSRPVSVSGWYQYVPAGVDTASFSITLTKWNAADSSEVVIGSGTFTVADTVTNWTEFTIPVNYVSDSIPDSSLLLGFSSAGAQVVIGSVLHLDDISYSYNPLGIKNVPSPQISIYPNPAQNSFVVDNATIHATVLKLYAADGNLVKTYTLHNGVNTLDVSGISSGDYLINAVDKNGVAYHNSLVIEK